MSFRSMTTEYRMRNGWSISELARRVNVSPSHISRIERGQRRPDLAVARRIVAALGLTPGQAAVMLGTLGYNPQDSAPVLADRVRLLNDVYFKLDPEEQKRLSMGIELLIRAFRPSFSHYPLDGLTAES